MPAKTENLINSVTSSVDTGTSIKFIGESDSTGNNLRIEDGKLSGTIVGSVIKDHTGRVDDVTLELANVPIDGIGGGSGGDSNVELVIINTRMDPTTNTVTTDSSSKSNSEIIELLKARKTVIVNAKMDVYVNGSIVDTSNVTVPISYFSDWEHRQSIIGYGNVMTVSDKESSSKATIVVFEVTVSDKTELPSLMTYTKNLQ